jgi:hypothetical protein
MLEGVQVRAFLPNSWDVPAPVVEAKTAEAFALLRDFGPRYLDRVRALTNGVLLLESVDAAGAWHRDARLVQLDTEYIAQTETKPIHVAATLVHEVTHAWLDSLGFSYAPPQHRARIEAICYRAEAAFARRVPGGEEAAAEYDEIARAISDGLDVWSDEDIRDRARAALKELGVPEWLVRVLSRVSSFLPGES